MRLLTEGGTVAVHLPGGGPARRWRVVAMRRDLVTFERVDHRGTRHTMTRDVGRHDPALIAR